MCLSIKERIMTGELTIDSSNLVLTRLIVLLLGSLFLGCGVWAQASDTNDTELFSWLPPLSPSTGVTMSVSHEFVESGSVWGEDLDERSVFHAALTCPQGGWHLGVGKGGQVYSLRGPYGEAVPPQIHKNSVWNDEVWQLVSVSTRLQNRAVDTGYPYYIHGSGTYERDRQYDGTLYCPILAEHVDAASCSYSVVTWGQQAHVPTPFRSGVLYTTRWQAIDPMTIEIVYGVHNFGEEMLDFFNVPWGGVRGETFPVRQIAQSDGSFIKQSGQFPSPKNAFAAPDTGGWLLFSKGDNDDAASMALVFGREAEPWPGAKLMWRGGYAGKEPNARDYAVSSNILKGKLEPGQSFWTRRFFVIGPRRAVCERAMQLVPSVETKRVNVLKGRVPVFRICEKPGVEFVETTDPYNYAAREPMKNPLSASDPLHAEFEKLQILRPYAAPMPTWKLIGYAEKPLANKEKL